MGDDARHKNDMYGTAGPRAKDAVKPAVPAATVVLLRDTDDGPQVLMLRKNSRIAFGGMWVFPGGRIDPEDYPEEGDPSSHEYRHAGARNAAAREAREEAGLDLDANDFVWFSHWTPPPDVPARFATWFFAARGHDQAINVDGGEIDAHRWIRPAEALSKHAAGEIDMVAPTWVTLYHLSRHSPAAALLARFRANPARFYVTRIGQSGEGVRVAMWRGDAGYDDWNPDIEGERHRLSMPAGGFTFEHGVVEY